MKKNNMEDFVKKSLCLIEDESLRIKIGNNARQLAVEIYDTKVLSKKFISFIGSFI